MPSAYEIFHRLLGTWKFTRTLTNKLDPDSSGSVEGSVSFLPNPLNKDLMHYVESGKLVTKRGLKFSINREYVYKLCSKETIEVHSSRERLPTALLFRLTFDQFDTIPKSLSAKHFCESDQYDATFTFNAESFRINYEVAGPSKLYISDTKYTRPAPSGSL